MENFIPEVIKKKLYNIIIIIKKKKGESLTSQDEFDDVT